MSDDDKLEQSSMRPTRSLDSNFKLKKVSNVDIQVTKAPESKSTIKGADWFPTAYPNVFIIAKKNSGKTTAIENMLTHFAGPKTIFIFIVSTIHKDNTWIRIVKHWEEKGNEVLAYDDFTDPETSTNVIEEFLSDQKTEAEELEREAAGARAAAIQHKLGGAPNYNKKPKFPLLGADGILNVTKAREQEAKRKEALAKLNPKAGGKKGGSKKPKQIVPEFIIVIDDMGSAMRNKSVTQLLKASRHFRSMVILSSQNLNDLMPESIRQLDYVLAFGKLPVEKLKSLRENLDLNISEETFIDLYADATKKPHSFLYIGRLPSSDIYRKGFTEQYELPTE